MIWRNTQPERPNSQDDNPQKRDSGEGSSELADEEGDSSLRSRSAATPLWDVEPIGPISASRAVNRPFAAEVGDSWWPTE